MRILHVITNLDTGGAEKLLVDLLPIIGTIQKVELALFVGTRTPFFERIEKAGIKIHIFFSRGSVYNPINIWKLLKLSKNFDIIHTHNTAPQLFGALTSMFSKSKFCTTEHTTSSRHTTWWFRPVERYMYGRYSSIICISEAVKYNILKLSLSLKKKTIVIPNGIDVSLYQNAKGLCIKEAADNFNKKIVLMVGRFSYQKDQATIIRAMSLLPFYVELWLVGYGPTEESLLSLAKTLHVENRVHLLGMRTDVPNLLKSSDIVVQSSHIEGFGLAAVEGMAAGKPVIASKVEGLADVVQNAGILFPHQNEKALASEILKLLNDSQYYERVTFRCQQRAKQFDIHKMAEDYLSVYNNLLIQN